VGAELFHTDTQTDVLKLIVSFRNFANAPKNVIGKVFILFEDDNPGYINRRT
jgi:hypothetical protein